MHIILGATGHVGSAVAQELLDAGEPVTVVSRSAEKAEQWKRKGATVALVDVYNTKALQALFQTGRRLFLLNPPAAPSTDTVAEEEKTLAAILEALKGSGIEKVVAESTYGAQPGEGHGDLNVLYHMEEALHKTGLAVSIIRAAYYMSNWDAYAEVVQQTGELPSLYPAHFSLPMVAPADIGKVAARLLREPINNTGFYYVEGPATYTPADVAAAFSKALNKAVKVLEIPESEWLAQFKKTGFSDKAAGSYAAMTKATLQGPAMPNHPIRGATTLQAYIQQVVNNARK